MSLTTKIRTIPQRLQATFPPVPNDGAFDELMRRLAETCGPRQATYKASRIEPSTERCLVLIETVFAIAVLEGITASALFGPLGDQFELTIKIAGEDRIVERLAKWIDRPVMH